MQSISCNIVSGEMLQMLCDIYIGEQDDFAYNPNIYMQKSKLLKLSSIPENYDNPSIVFVYTHRIFDFFSKYIYKFKNRFILVSHNSDKNIDESFKAFADHHLIVHWFSQNANIKHEKISYIPIGVANTQWQHGNRELFNNIKPISFKDKAKLVYFQFSIHTNPEKRLLCKSKLEKYYTFTENVSQIEYLNRLNSSKFIIAPEGNGIDTHRLWESLFCGSIPIVKKCILTEEISKIFPIILIEDWDEVTPAFLENKSKEYENINISYKKLSIEYYKNVINTYKIPIIYVHLGNAFFPNYLNDSIHQARLWNPINPVHVIIDKKYFENFNDKTITLVDIDKVPMTKISEDFNKITKLNTSFRDGFWRFSTERLIVLYNYLFENKIQKSLHLENDNMLYTSLLDIMDYFYDHTPMYCATMYNAEVLFNFFIINNLEAFEKLAHYFTYNNPHNKTEMPLGYDFITTYPSLLKTLPGKPEESATSIFDAAPFGQYLAGIDPRNGDSSPGFCNSNATFNTSHYYYRWVKSNNLYYIETTIKTDINWKKINVLHIHSKMLNTMSSLLDIPRCQHLLKI
jgi:hypothetical protein